MSQVQHILHAAPCVQDLSSNQPKGAQVSHQVMRMNLPNPHQVACKQQQNQCTLKQGHRCSNLKHVPLWPKVEPQFLFRRCCDQLDARKAHKSLHQERNQDWRLCEFLPENSGVDLRQVEQQLYFIACQEHEESDEDHSDKGEQGQYQGDDHCEEVIAGRRGLKIRVQLLQLLLGHWLPRQTSF